MTSPSRSPEVPPPAVGTEGGAAGGPGRWSLRARRLATLVVACVTLGFGVVGLAAGLLAARGGSYRIEPQGPPTGTSAPGAEQVAALPAGKLPRGVWVAVDLYENRLRVYRGAELLREAVCSTGSGRTLRDPSDEREWVFETPLGRRTVQRKVRNPVWIKPDWAFIEEGLEPPALGSPERRDDVSLGDYALYLGDGYLIHGTLFQTLLGRRVTHGCIRLGDQDLEFVYRTVPVGAPVYLH